MNKEKLYHYRNLLEEEKKQSIRTLELKNKNNQNTNMQSYINELSMYDNHPADIGTEVFQAEMNINLKKHEEKYLEMLNKSIERIEKGDYGKCIDCGNYISEERLEVLPTSLRCIECQKKVNPPEDLLNTRPSEELVLKSMYNDINYNAEQVINFDDTPE